MAIQLAKTGKVAPVINVTPLVDVVLVLLIIFMVIAPLLEKEIVVNLPAAQMADSNPENDTQIVMDLGPDGKVQVNGVDVARGRLEEHLRSLIAPRRDKVVFFQADDAAGYGDAVRVLDAARGAGAETIGTVLATPGR
ncbi:MAG: biopolymer transporter ExbD [Deltaproteobacteria bacterium]|nr:biopolymer transporter ExbD [Deltaproteobacteria bacterium]